MNASSRFSLCCNEHLRGTSAIIHEKLFGPFQLSTKFCIVQDLTASQSAITLAMIYEHFDEFCCSLFVIIYICIQNKSIYACRVFRVREQCQQAWFKRLYAKHTHKSLIQGCKHRTALPGDSWTHITNPACTVMASNKKYYAGIMNERQRAHIWRLDRYQSKPLFKDF